ncbi:hypothetical protein NQ318_003973 [Aromia moschata]|uniref:Cytochrome c oxidase subunit 5A, mitochondrial n=1 Tax=Aromia moschata TaxID=1265417 RepID=A0AAV8Z7N3_9CUCU|nr:hypothetical protein NQ318_003973 [Aromia moschata]
MGALLIMPLLSPISFIISPSHLHFHFLSPPSLSRYECLFGREDADGWEVRQAMNDLAGYDSVPDPRIVIAGLHACRRLNDYALSVRFLEMVKAKCGSDVAKIYPYIIQEVGSTVAELGTDFPESLGYDVPELYLESVFDMKTYEVRKLTNETGNVAPDLTTLRRQDLEERWYSPDRSFASCYHCHPRPLTGVQSSRGRPFGWLGRALMTAPSGCSFVQLPGKHSGARVTGWSLLTYTYAVVRLFRNTSALREPEAHRNLSGNNTNDGEGPRWVFSFEAQPRAARIDASLEKSEGRSCFRGTGDRRLLRGTYRNFETFVTPHCTDIRRLWFLFLKSPAPSPLYVLSPGLR